MFTLDEVLSKSNQKEALEFLTIKGNSRGAEGMFMSDLEEYWNLNGQVILKELQDETYEPGLAKSTEIINKKGKRRLIYNLPAIDRFISRMLSQKLRQHLEPEFMKNSFAYQENKGYYPTGHPNAEKSIYNLGEQDGYVLNGHPLYNSDINGIAWDKSQEFLASKGLSWSTANWFEARYGYLSRQEAEMVGVNIANTTLKVWGQIAYLKEVIRNHQRFDTLQDALKADGYDTIPFSAGIVTIGVMSRFNPEIGFIGGVLGGFGSNININQKKEELKKAESGDPSYSDAKSMNSEV